MDRIYISKYIRIKTSLFCDNFTYKAIRVFQFISKEVVLVILYQPRANSSYHFF